MHARIGVISLVAVRPHSCRSATIASADEGAHSFLIGGKAGAAYPASLFRRDWLI